MAADHTGKPLFVRGSVAAGEEVRYNARMGRTVVRGDFEWDVHCEQVRTVHLDQYKKHGISFEEATRVFRDPFFVDARDEEHSSLDEERMVGIGILHDLVTATTVFVERDRIRLISARQANKKEEARYYEWRFSH